MVFKGKIDAEKRAFLRYARLHGKVPCKELTKTYGVSRSTLLRICKSTKIGREHRKPAKRPGPKKKLTARCERQILRQIERLRKKEGGFTSRRLMEVAGIHLKNISDRTVRRLLNRKGYFYLQARKKGLMSDHDCKRRVQFAKHIKRHYRSNVWTDKIAFYLDGVSFAHKINPADQARAPKARVWRQRCEGLRQGCTAKGQKVGTGGKVLRLMVAISYKEGLLLCDQYEKLNGEYFSSLVKKEFERMFVKSNKRSRLWIQDGDPSQNSALAQKEFRKVRSKLLSIPPRSPDLNPIENFFHIVRRSLDKDALKRNITRESYDEFSTRVRDIIFNVPKELINKTIESLPRRIDMILKSKGQRLKY